MAARTAVVDRPRGSAEWTDAPLMLRAFGFHHQADAAASQASAASGTRIERTEIPATHAVQRRSLPGAPPTGPAPGPDAEESGDEAADRAAQEAAREQAADQVETLLSRPDPVAGVGTPQDALRVLAALPMGELLGTLDVLEQRGRLSDILPFVDAGDADAAGRVRAALDARALARMSPGEAQGAPLDALAATLERMPADEQNGVYRYLIARRHPARDLETLLEGILAMQRAAVDQREQMPAAAGTLATPGPAKRAGHCHPRHGPPHPHGNPPRARRDLNMQLPTLFHGLYRDVKRRTTRIVNQIPKGGDWMALVEAEGFLDTDTAPGYIVLQGPSPLLGGEPHFQAWLLLEQIWLKWKEWGQETMEGIFQQSLSRPWSMLGLVSSQNNHWFIPRHRYRPFLRAVRQYWDVFDSVGQRYTDGSRQGFDLWSLPNSIKYVLANLGVPGETLRAPLPPGGLAELIDRTERHLH